MAKKAVEKKPAGKPTGRKAKQRKMTIKTAGGVMTFKFAASLHGGCCRFHDGAEDTCDHTISRQQCEQDGGVWEEH